MIWLNGVLAVPAIGIRISTAFTAMLDFQYRMTDFLEVLKDDNDNITIDSNNQWGFAVSTTSGFHYELQPKNIAIKFGYVVEKKVRAGSFPTSEYPDISTYTELLEKLCKQIQDIFSNLDSIEGIKFDRLGIVALTDLSQESIPPGLTLWLDHMGKPWLQNQGVQEVEAKIVTALNVAETHKDQCIHNIKFDEDALDERGYKFTLDWQRVFNEPMETKPGKIKECLDDCIEQAQKYFQTFGEGNLNYE